jgi:catechol 2,3-dioxygenase
MTIQEKPLVQSLGHVVLNVRDQATAEEFYHGKLGFPIAARSEKFKMTFFTLGNHHDLAVRAVGEDAPVADGRKGVGLFHVAFKVGDSLDDLRGVKAQLEARGVAIDSLSDHDVTASIYLRDPDGNGLELYVDTDSGWQQDPQRVATGKPLEL